MDIKGLTFLSGVELPDGSAMFACQEGDLDQAEFPNTVVAIRSPDGEWHDGGYLEQTTAAVGQGPDHDALFLAGPDGRLLEYFPGAPNNTRIMPEDDIGHEIRSLATIGGSAYAVGTDRHIHMRHPRGGWFAISTDAMHRVSEGSAGFEALAGYGEAELYAVGWNGEIWTNAEGAWASVESPTNVILTSITAASDRIYACGQMGVILEGRGSDWRAVEHEETNETFWSARTFGDAVFLAADFGVMKLYDGILELSFFVNDDMRTAGDLFVGPSGLWSVGSKDIALFDGKAWRTIAQS